MLIGLLGLNHKTAPVEVRERVAFEKAGLRDALRALREHCPEGFILSTCNRMEVYGLIGHQEKGRRKLVQFLSEYHNIPARELHDHLYFHHQVSAIRHLFSVAAGLDSMILGEPQILNQLKVAFEVASTSGATGTILSRLLRQALRVGKRARSETGISRHAISISYAAVQLAHECLGDLSQSEVLVVGTGEMGELTARILINGGVRSVVIANRTFASASELAKRLGGEPIEFYQLGQALERADVVISATGAPGYVIDATRMKDILQRRARPLLLIDIAVPRDIDPAVRSLENALLHDIDDLERICSENLLHRQREIEKVQVIIDQEVEEFIQWWNSIEVIPTIKALVAHVEAIRETELAKTLPKLAGLSERELSAVVALTHAIAGKVLHRPITRMKQGKRSEDGYDYARAVKELFGLNPSASDEESGGIEIGEADDRDPAGVSAERPTRAMRQVSSEAPIEFCTMQESTNDNSKRNDVEETSVR